MSFLKKLFGKKQRQNWTEEALDAFYIAKDKAIQGVLGEQTPTVGHAIIPFEIGGAVDMYYYHHKVKGTFLQRKN